MNLEDEMYRVMAALSAGDVPVDFKGAMVLHAFLYEKGFSETAIRPTRDIDANWLSDTPPGMDEIVRAFQQVLDQNHILFTVKFFVHMVMENLRGWISAVRTRGIRYLPWIWTSIDQKQVYVSMPLGTSGSEVLW